MYDGTRTQPHGGGGGRMSGTQQDLTESATDARHRGDVTALDAWFADDLPSVDQALAFAEFVVLGMDAQHFADYDIGCSYLQAFEEYYTAELPRTTGQTNLERWV